MPRLSDAEKRSDAGLRRMIEYGIAEGWSMGATERHFELTGSTVSRACSRLKIAYPVHKNASAVPHSDDDLRRMIEYGIAEGWSMNATEKEFKLTKSTIRLACSRLKIAYPLHKGAGAVPHSDDDLRRMIEYGIAQGMSMNATEKHFELPQNAITRACGRLKIVYPVHTGGASKKITIADSLTQTAIRELRDQMFLAEAATALGIGRRILENRFQELCPEEHWTPKWPNGSKVIPMKNETRPQLQERVDGVNQLRAELESRLDDVRTPTPPGTCSMPASVTRPRCAPAGRGHLPEWLWMAGARVLGCRSHSRGNRPHAEHSRADQGEA